jgi:hypothetical protein
VSLFSANRPQIDRRRSLALVPVRNPHAAWGPLAGPHPVTISIPLQRKPAPKLLFWLAQKLTRKRPPDSRILELDQMGSFVWRAIDGKTAVRALIWLLVAEYRLNRKEAEVALMEFLGQLSKRNLLALANIDSMGARN